jgi:FkbM family methyltransferase
MSENLGIIYMTFGPVSVLAAIESLKSVRAQKIDLPVISIGTHKVPGTTFIQWEGNNPWGPETVPGRLRFWAGNVKPFLYKYTPFEYNLYLDADTEVWGDIMPGFDYLKEYDMCISKGCRWMLEDLFKPDNKKPDWNAPRKERDHTSKFLTGYPPDKHPYINSGVIFFHKNERLATLFDEWYRQWKRIPNWQEEMAFLRAMKNCPDVKVLRLTNDWNNNSPDENTLVYHMWGLARDLHPIPRDGYPSPKLVEMKGKRAVTDPLNPLGLVFADPGWEEKVILKEIQTDYRTDTWGLGPKDIVIEIGGHVGEVSMTLAKKYGCRVYVFEASPFNYGRLIKNIQQNKLTDLVKVHHLAVTKDGRKIRMSMGKNSGAHHIYGAGGDPEVPSITLSKILSTVTGTKRPISLLLIDCEGAEYEILEDLVPLKHIKAIRGEFHATGAHGDMDLLLARVQEVVPDTIVNMQRKIARNEPVVVFTPDLIDKKKKLAQLDGRISPMEGEYLTYLATQIPKDGAIVEIGPYRGMSTCYLGMGLVIAENTTAVLHTIDIWTMGRTGSLRYHLPETPKIFKEQIISIFGSFPSFIHPHMTTSLRAAAKRGKPINLLFIDGSHKYEDVHADWLAWNKFVPIGGYIAFHDHELPKYPGVCRVVDEEVIPTGNWASFNQVERLWSAIRIR